MTNVDNWEESNKPPGLITVKFFKNNKGSEHAQNCQHIFTSIEESSVECITSLEVTKKREIGSEEFIDR